MRIALVSDTHIAARARAFTANWHIAARLIEAERPDLIIHLGDITVDGAGDPAEHGQALDAMQALSAPRLAVPGNHDLGDNPPHPGAHVSSPVTPARLAAWAAGNSDRTAGLWGAEAIRVLRLADERVSRGLNARGVAMMSWEVGGRRIALKNEPGGGWGATVKVERARRSC